MRFFLGKVILCCLIFAAAAPVAEASDTAEGGHRLNVLMQKAALYEATADTDFEFWQAAVIYCEASKLGSTEAQYRLGMLYLLGKGVPENRAYAASLFSMASQQGHR